MFNFISKQLTLNNVETATRRQNIKYTKKIAALRRQFLDHPVY